MEHLETNKLGLPTLSSITPKIAVIDRKGTVVSVNAAWEEFAKKPAIPDLCMAGIGDNYQDACRKMMDSGNPHGNKILEGIESLFSQDRDEFYIECQIPLENKEFWFALTARFSENEGLQATLILEDITEKKRFQKHLESSIDSIASPELPTNELGSFELNFKDNTTRWCDEHFRIFGLSPQSEAMTYEKFLGFVHPAYIGRVSESFQRLIRDGQEIELHYGIVLRDGTTRYIHGKARSVKESNGTIITIKGTVQDVTESFGREIKVKDETFHHSLTPVAISDLEGRITYANPAFVSLWGFDNESEVLGLSNRDLGNSPEKISEIMDAVQTFGRWSGKDRAKKKDGTLFDIYLNTFLVKDSKGMPMCVTATFVDITEQEKAKQRLVEVEGKSKILFDYSPIIIWEEDFSEVKSFFRELVEWGVKDYRSYFESAPDEVKRLASLVRVTRVNQRSLDFYGVGSFEELKTDLPDWFMEDSWDVFKEELIALAEGQWQFEGEILVKSPMGEIKHLYMSLTVPPQYIDTLEVVVVAFIDITETKEKEKLLREKEREIREYSTELEQMVADRTKELRYSKAKLVEANKVAKIGHWSLDDPNEGVKWSDGLYEIYGIDKNTRITKELFFEKIHFDDRERIAERIRAISLGEPVENLEYRIIDAKGNEKYIRSINSPPIFNGWEKKKTQFGVIQDITHQKIAENKLMAALEKEHELNELKSRFVSMASHEFRTPLTAISSSVILLRKYNELGIVDKQEKLFGRIKNSVSNLTTILDDFLSLEKMELGKVQLSKREIDFHDYLRDILEEVKPWSKEKQRLVHEYTGDKEVIIDPNLTRNVLLNILSNALKYSPEESIVKMVTQNVSGKLVIKVIDQGMGIPQAEQEKMFTRFFRASNATTIGGTGLGLTIVKRYLDLMEGKISFVSKTGKGSTFTVVIPLA